MNEKPERQMLSVKEAAAWLGISAFTLYTWAQTGKVPYYKIEKRVLFGRDDLWKWLERHRRNAG
ncbi:MAG TPA: helix-turn-helix domain-containing protein [Planctomycetota bacterium]